MIFSIRESKELHENDSDLLEDVAVLGRVWSCDFPLG